MFRSDGQVNIGRLRTELAGAGRRRKHPGTTRTQTQLLTHSHLPEPFWLVDMNSPMS